MACRTDRQQKVKTVAYQLLYRLHLMFSVAGNVSCCDVTVLQCL
jgi:hypothetical protein